MFAETYQNGVTLEHLKFVHSEWDKQHGVPLQAEWQGHDNIPDAEKQLRIGFISPDLGRHPVGYFISNLLKYKKSSIKFICYSNRAPDDLTEYLMKLSDQWHDVRGISDATLTERIRSDQIDILIDLSGHTAGNKLLVFARKPAPIQVSWAGYMGTTGLSAIDYLIADHHHAPKGVDQYYSEKLIRLPNGYVSYEAPNYSPVVSTSPFEKNSFITFGCFNNPAKINERVLKIWNDILQAVPNSRLILKYRHMDAKGNRDRIFRQICTQGVTESRLTLEGYSQHIELFSRYNDIDVALDTFPYSGGLTTCEALWMGVPVITLPDETFASRHTLSHLTNLGLPDMVAQNSCDYIDIAVKLASDVNRLKKIRYGLRVKMSQSPLCDGETFAADFNYAMRQIWKEWCQSQNFKHVINKS